jgi:IrrE N-terminal-like domain
MSLLNDNRVKMSEAETVRRYTSSFPVKVGELAKELGLIVTRAPMPPKISGLIKPCPDAPAGFEIRVNKYESAERQRFTVAHEIAHYLLHRNDIGAGVVDSIMYRSNLTSRKETEANQLAADIVMPAKIVSLELKQLGGSRTDDTAEKLASVFRVSVPAMKIRLGVA